VIIGITSLTVITLCTLLYARTRKKTGTELPAPLNLERASILASLPLIGRIFANKASTKADPIQILLGSTQAPITSMPLLAQTFKNELPHYASAHSTKKQPIYPEVASVVIYGDKLEITELMELDPLKPKKIILVGATIYHRNNERNTLKNIMSVSGWEFHDAPSLDEALKTPVKLTTDKSQTIPVVYTVVTKN